MSTWDKDNNGNGHCILTETNLSCRKSSTYNALTITDNVSCRNNISYTVSTVSGKRHGNINVFRLLAQDKTIYKVSYNVGDIALNSEYMAVDILVYVAFSLSSCN